jgi:hypothetical protein
MFKKLHLACLTMTCTALFAVASVARTPLQIWYQDLDNDGYGNSSITIEAVEQPAGYVAVGGDCDDTNPNVNPGILEICGNGIDDDCDGNIDVDNSAPQAICIGALNLLLDENGTASISVEDVDDGSYDNCSIATSVLSKSVFYCTDPLAQSVTLTLTDSAGNIGQCTVTVLVKDKMPPVAICAPTLIAPLDFFGNLTLTPEQIDNGSYDACIELTTSIDRSEFNCNDIGDHVITLSMYDGIGNYNSCTTLVSVVDKTKPVAICKPTLVANLDEQGTATIPAGAVDNGSYDVCAPINYFLSDSTFDCSDLGTPVVVALLVMDSFGNTSSCTVEISVSDKTAPVAVCAEAIILPLDAAGMASLSVENIDNGSFDNCAIATRVLDIFQFDCDDLGPNTVTLTVTDSASNSNQCTTVVTVIDKTNPVALCVETYQAALNDVGEFLLLPQMLNNGSSDNCGGTNMALSQSLFTVAHLGENDVLLTVTDNAENTSDCASKVIISQTTAMHEVAVKSAGMVASPNPSSGVFQLQFEPQIQVEWMRVHQLSGALVAEMPANSTIVDLTQQPAGTYMLLVKIAGTQHLRHIMLQKA